MQQRFPSVRTLMTRLHVAQAQAEELRVAMRHKRALRRYNRMAGLHGVESFCFPENSPNPAFECLYVNTGETYGTTLLRVNGIYRVGSWGNVMERRKR